MFNDLEEQTVYIGQSTNGAERIKEHIKKKDFWTYCILIVSDNNGFDHSVINYLEYYFIEAFKDTYFTMDNYQSKPIPIIDPFLKVTYLNYASQIKFLLEANSVFFVNKKIKVSKNLVFKAGKGKEAELYLHDGIYFLSGGSIIRRPIDTSKDWSDGGRFFEKYNNMFNEFIQTGKAIAIDEVYARLTENVPFKSPSAPASLCSGGAENGYNFWQGLAEYRK